MFSWKKFCLGLVISILAIAVVFCLVTLIFSSVNGITFVEQLKEWFSFSKETVEETVETTARIGMLK